MKSSRNLREPSFEALLPPPAGHIISTVAADTGNTGTLQHPPGIGDGFNGISTERYILFHHCCSVGVRYIFIPLAANCVVLAIDAPLPYGDKTELTKQLVSPQSQIDLN